MDLRGAMRRGNFLREEAPRVVVNDRKSIFSTGQLERCNLFGEFFYTRRR